MRKILACLLTVIVVLFSGGIWLPAEAMTQVYDEKGILFPFVYDDCKIAS